MAADVAAAGAALEIVLESAAVFLFGIVCTGGSVVVAWKL